MLELKTPYLLFIGHATDPLSIKMAKSAADWSPEKCVGEVRSHGCTVTTGMPAMTIAEGIAAGARSLVLGFANSGGHLDEQWLPMIHQAIAAGLDIISGLHDRLNAYEELVNAAAQNNVRLLDIRHPTKRLKTGKGYRRAGKRVLTVGTDCSVGKMYTSLSMTREMQRRGIPVTFRATGQSGILVAGEGIAVDCVVADFIAGAVEEFAPANAANHWDIIEGQGSLFHPAFAGVSLGLLHGAQADALVVCHALGRSSMRAIDNRPLPSLTETIALNEQMARVTNPNAKVIGIAVNTSSVTEAEAQDYCRQVEQELGLPCVDPIRHGVATLVDKLEEN
ncbi:N-acetyltransferase DgcN [Pseudidiomarina homiensis]|uniref:N-acetyltransferase DgcN n=1 Tax=Pseudidiomarina homiensis TaxID=364198 RepID=UPI00215B26B6|nr:N-acetyltransferase DgcN [Pseudidiomarina homiensis]